MKQQSLKNAIKIKNQASSWKKNVMDQIMQKIRNWIDFTSILYLNLKKEIKNWRQNTLKYHSPDWFSTMGFSSTTPSVSCLLLQWPTPVLLLFDFAESNDNSLLQGSISLHEPVSTLSVFHLPFWHFHLGLVCWCLFSLSPINDDGRPKFHCQAIFFLLSSYSGKFHSHLQF